MWYLRRLNAGGCQHKTHSVSGVQQNTPPTRLMPVDGVFSDSYSYPLSPYMKLAYSGYEYSYWQEGINLDLVKGKDVVIFMPYIYNANSLKVIPATE